jgi:hypothetical protein
MWTCLARTLCLAVAADDDDDDATLHHRPRVLRAIREARALVTERLERDTAAIDAIERTLRPFTGTRVQSMRADRRARARSLLASRALRIAHAVQWHRLSTLLEHQEAALDSTAALVDVFSEVRSYGVDCRRLQAPPVDGTTAPSLTGADVVATMKQHRHVRDDVRGALREYSTLATTADDARIDATLTALLVAAPAVPDDEPAAAVVCAPPLPLAIEVLDDPGQ